MCKCIIYNVYEYIVHRMFIAHGMKERERGEKMRGEGWEAGAKGRGGRQY